MKHLALWGNGILIRVESVMMNIALRKFNFLQREPVGCGQGPVVTFNELEKHFECQVQFHGLNGLLMASGIKENRTQ